MNIIGKIKFRTLDPVSQENFFFTPSGFCATARDGRRYSFAWVSHYPEIYFESDKAVYEIEMYDFDDVYLESSSLAEGTPVEAHEISPKFLLGSTLTVVHCECSLGIGRYAPMELVSFSFRDKNDPDNKEYSLSPEQIEKANLVIRKLEEAVY